MKLRRTQTQGSLLQSKVYQKKRPTCKAILVVNRIGLESQMAESSPLVGHFRLRDKRVIPDALFGRETSCLRRLVDDLGPV